MPITWSIVQSLISIKVTDYGAYSLRETVREILASPLFKPSMFVLLDRTRASDNPSSDELRQRAQWLSMLLTRRNRSRCALVVGDKSHELAVGRAFAGFLRAEGIGTGLFTSVEDAAAWLVAREAEA